ncbi:MAG: glycosyltransferase family 2 protein [Coriobacteriales bacterium]|nr:glycosyltransferase family 2 protein [Coriobacteriales bacterium]
MARDSYAQKTQQRSSRGKSLVRATAMCRGEGVGYVAFETLVPSAELAAIARVKGGGQVPCDLIPHDGPGSWVAVVPLLAKEITIDVLMEGQVIGRLEFPALRSKVRSRLLTATKPQIAQALRGMEQRVRWGWPLVQITEAFPSTEGNVVWRVRASFPTDDATLPVGLEAFDDRGVRLSATVFVLEDHVVPNVRDASQEERLVTCSCVLPESVQSFYVIASLTDDQTLAGFAGMNAPRAQGMLADARLRIAGAAADSEYGLWFQTHRVTKAELERQRRMAAELDAAKAPLISVVMPVFRPDAAFVREAIESVLRQSYGQWELVVVNASGACEPVDAVLRGVSDTRVRVLEVENRSIAENTNAGIAAAQGDYVAFLDHDDVLEPDALWHYVQAIGQNSQVDLLYCDEDRLGEGGVRTPAFKTFPNYGKLYTHNYITHLLMVSRFVLDHTERTDVALSGAQDYDLTLKAFEVARNVVHVPRVLYHWRDHEGSTAGGGDQKPYAHEAGRNALEAHLARRGIAAYVVDGPLPYTYDVRYELTDFLPKVSIVIPTRDHPDLLSACVCSILERSTYARFQIVLVENGSQDERTFALYDQLCARDDRVRVVTWEPPEPGAFNYSALVNYGVEHTSGEYVVLLNNDTEVIEPEWIEELLRCFARPEVGVVGAKLLYADGLVQHVGLVANPNGDFCHVCQNVEGGALGPAYAVAMPGDYSMVTGACQMVRRSVFDELGGYSERLAVGFNDGDFCLRARERGYVSTVAAHAVLYHREFASRGRERTDARLRERYLSEKGRMLVRHAEFFSAGDAVLNPNLDGFGTYFELGE